MRVKKGENTGVKTGVKTGIKTRNNKEEKVYHLPALLDGCQKHYNLDWQHGG